MPRHDPHTLRRARVAARVLGALVGVVVGVFYGGFVITNSPGFFSGQPTAAAGALAGSAIVGAAALALAGPLLSVEPYLWLEHTLDEASPSQILAAVAGIVSALVIAALIALLLSPLPLHVGEIVSLAVACTLVYAGATTGTRRRDAFASLLRTGSDGVRALTGRRGGKTTIDGPPVVVDTSVIIDGRILDVARSGFVPGRLLLPGFVLEELQRLADAGDPMRRARGRRGITVVEELKRQQNVVCEVVDLDFPDTREVDARLIKLAMARDGVLMTSDYTLNRLAQVAGVRVLNLNDLANALKPILSAGEELTIAIVKEGKELHQGVGYLEDGTMVVVENGSQHLGNSVRATVTSVLQTSAGRMIFATTEAASASLSPVRAPRARAAQR